MADRFPLILNTSANQIQEIASGDTLDLTNNNIANAGIITAGNVTVGAATTDLIVNGDARITGILTIGTSSLKLDGPNNLVNVGTALTLGHTQGLQFHTQNLHSAGFEVNQINTSGIITATEADINGDLDVDGHTELDNLNVTGVSTFGGNINTNGDLDVDGHTNLDNVSIAGVVTTGDHVTLSGQNPRITFTDTNHNPDFEIYGSAGNFKIWDSTSNVGRLIVNSDGHVDIPGNLDCGAGLDVTGTITGTSHVDLPDAAQIKLGDNDEFLIYHTATGTSYIKETGSGDLYIDATNIRLRSQNGNNKLVTSSTGVDITGNATVSGNLSVGGVLTYEDVTNIDSIGIITARSSIKLDADGSSSSNFLSIGADDDLKIFHQSNVDKIESSANGFHIRQINNGDLHIHAGANTGSANNRLVARAGGKAELYYAGALKLSTETGGVNITGVCTATTFVGALTGTASGNATISSNASTRIITGGSGNALTGNSDLLWNGSRLDIDTGGTEDALRIGSSSGADTFIRLGSINTTADTHAVIKYDRDDNYLSLLVSGESHGNGGVLVANGGNVGLFAGTSPASRLTIGYKAVSSYPNGNASPSGASIDNVGGDAFVGRIFLQGNNRSANSDYLTGVNNEGSSLVLYDYSNNQYKQKWHKGLGTELWYAGSKRFETYDSGARVIGDLALNHSSSSTEVTGFAVQRIWQPNITAGNVYKCGQWYEGEGAVQLYISVRSVQGGHSGSATYLFQGGYSVNASNGTQRLLPLASGRGHGDSADTGMNSNAWEVLIDQINGYTYALYIHVPSGRANKMMQVSVTEMNRGNTFTDFSSTVAYSSISSSVLTSSPLTSLQNSHAQVVRQHTLPAFRAGRGGSDQNVGSGDAMLFNYTGGSSLYFNQGGHYNPSTGRFTAPYAGVYHFYALIIFEQVSDNTDMTDSWDFYLNNSQLAFSSRRTKYRQDYTGTSGYYTDPGTITIYMNKDDYVWCRNKYAGKILHSNPTYSYFCGHFCG